MTALLVSPLDFENRRVQTVGYFPSDGLEIYLTSEHADVDDFASSIFLETQLSVEHCPESFVHVEGVFYFGQEGWTIKADALSGYVSTTGEGLSGFFLRRSMN